MSQIAFTIKKELQDSITLETMKNHLRNMLMEHYGIFMNEGFGSIEFAEEFVEAAKAVGMNAESLAAERWITDNQF